ncbi:hypothetical protein A3K72_00185 [Candidatus Woesearchaeota archaeon RBG_13_36_6]|nr:MAG: hypothetical protein A3K72_00185 [Candidatus Woesearchaeota archaeon RBG_13_36_6]
MSLVDDIKQNQVVLFVISKKDYTEMLLDVIKAVEKASDKVCYVTINRPYNNILLQLKNNKVNLGKFFFVDAITSTVQTPEQVENCIFVASPDALTDLSLAFSQALGKCDIALFDTMSTLVIYQDIGSVLKFMHNIVTKLRVGNKKGVLIALKEDSEELIKDLHMFVDKVVDLTI